MMMMMMITQWRWWIQGVIKMWCDYGDDVFANRTLQKINPALGSFSTNQVKKLNQNYILHKQIKASGNSDSWVKMSPSAIALPADKTIICKTIKLSRACWAPQKYHENVLHGVNFFPTFIFILLAWRFYVFGPQWLSVPEKMQRGGWRAGHMHP